MPLGVEESDKRNRDRAWWRRVLSVSPAARSNSRRVILQKRLDLLQGQAFVSQADNAMQAVNDCLIKEPIIALRPPRFFNEPKFQIKVQRIAGQTCHRSEIGDHIDFLHDPLDSLYTTLLLYSYRVLKLYSFVH